MAEAPPRIKRVAQLETEAFARRGNRIVIRHARGRPVAVIEVVSPGNKDRDHSVRRFAGQVRDFLNRSVGVMIVDLFPPGRPLAVVAYDAGEPLTSYLEPLAVGDC